MLAHGQRPLARIGGNGVLVKSARAMDQSLTVTGLNHF